MHYHSSGSPFPTPRANTLINYELDYPRCRKIIVAKRGEEMDVSLNSKLSEYLWVVHHKYPVSY